VEKIKGNPRHILYLGYDEEMLDFDIDGYIKRNS